MAKTHSPNSHVINRLVGCAALTLAAAACEDPARDLGQTSDMRGAPLTGDVEQAQLLSDFAGVWIGEVEDALAIDGDDEVTLHRFPSGSTRIRLVVTDPINSSTITFGEAEPPPPATDPSVGYPPDPGFRLGLVTMTPPQPPIEGFVYSTSSATDLADIIQLGFDGLPEFDGEVAPDGKLSLSFAPDEVLSGWCALQETDAVCDAVGTMGFGSDDAGTECTVAGNAPVPVPVDCQKASLCASQRCSSSDASMLSLRLSREGLIGAFSELRLMNERGYITYPGIVRFRPEATSPASTQ